MTRAPWLGMSLTLLLGCSQSQPPSTPLEATVSIDWRVRCEMTGDCAGFPDHQVDGLESDAVFDIACNALGYGEAGNRGNQMSFTAARGDEFGIEVRGANLQEGASEIERDGSCLVSVVEDGMRLEGRCSSEPPSDLYPCQISELEVLENSAGLIDISGTLYCEQLRPAEGSEIAREVTASGDEGATLGAPFHLTNCCPAIFCAGR